MSNELLFIVSRHKNTRENLQKVLKNDFSLKVFLSESEAWKHLQSSKIPIGVILDLSWEEKHPFRFIDKVRNNPVTRALPFVVVSRQSDSLSIEKAVRSGVSHYIGIPYEAAILLEKVKIALNRSHRSERQSYFTIPSQISTHIVAYGRVSYIHKNGIHFETNLKLQPEEKMSIFSPLCESLSLPNLSVNIQEIGRDVYYNYPFAIDAEWTEESVKEKVEAWVRANRHLNSPKKAKILFLEYPVHTEEELLKRLNLSLYSPRFLPSLEQASVELSFMNPKLVALSKKHWGEKSPSLRQKFLKKLSDLKMKWVLSGELENNQQDPDSKAFCCPEEPNALVQAVEKLVPPLSTEPDRIYFSKKIEDSRLKIFMSGKTLVMGEEGIQLALDHEIVPPCNFRLDLKVFTKQDLRNPFVRAWPPISRVESQDSGNGKFPFRVNTHFLGINDEQGQALRHWLHQEELKERAQELAPITPKRGPQEPSTH